MLVPTDAPDLLFEPRDFLAKGAHEFLEFVAGHLLVLHLTRFAQIAEYRERLIYSSRVSR